MQIRMSLYALRLESGRCVVCLDIDGVTEPVCIVDEQRAAGAGVGIRDDPVQAQRMAEALAQRDAQRAIDAARGRT